MLEEIEHVLLFVNPVQVFGRRSAELHLRSLQIGGDIGVVDLHAVPVLDRRVGCREFHRGADARPVIGLGAFARNPFAQDSLGKNELLFRIADADERLSGLGFQIPVVEFRAAAAHIGVHDLRTLGHRVHAFISLVCILSGRKQRLGRFGVVEQPTVLMLFEHLHKRRGNQHVHTELGILVERIHLIGARRVDQLEIVRVRREQFAAPEDLGEPGGSVDLRILRHTIHQHLQLKGIDRAHPFVGLAAEDEVACEIRRLRKQFIGLVQLVEHPRDHILLRIVTGREVAFLAAQSFRIGNVAYAHRKIEKVVGPDEMRQSAVSRLLDLGSAFDHFFRFDERRIGAEARPADAVVGIVADLLAAGQVLRKHVVVGKTLGGVAARIHHAEKHLRRKHARRGTVGLIRIDVDFVETHAGAHHRRHDEAPDRMFEKFHGISG